MTFTEEVRHVMPVQDETGADLVVCDPIEAREVFFALAEQKGYDLAPHWDDWMMRPETVCIVRLRDGALVSVHAYWRKYPAVAFAMMAIGQSAGRVLTIKRALHDVGIREICTHVDRESSHLQRLRDVGYEFEQLPSGRFFGKYRMEERP